MKNLKRTLSNDDPSWALDLLCSLGLCITTENDEVSCIHFKTNSIKKSYFSDDLCYSKKTSISHGSIHKQNQYKMTKQKDYFLKFQKPQPVQPLKLTFPSVNAQPDARLSCINLSEPNSASSVRKICQEQQIYVLPDEKDDYRNRKHIESSDECFEKSNINNSYCDYILERTSDRYIMNSMYSLTHIDQVNDNNEETDRTNSFNKENNSSASIHCTIKQNIMQSRSYSTSLSARNSFFEASLNKNWEETATAQKETELRSFDRMTLQHQIKYIKNDMNFIYDSIRKSNREMMDTIMKEFDEIKRLIRPLVKHFDCGFNENQLDEDSTDKRIESRKNDKKDDIYWATWSNKFHSNSESHEEVNFTKKHSICRSLSDVSHQKTLIKPRNCNSYDRVATRSLDTLKAKHLRSIPFRPSSYNTVLSLKDRSYSGDEHAGILDLKLYPSIMHHNHRHFYNRHCPEYTPNKQISLIHCKKTSPLIQLHQSSRIFSKRTPVIVINSSDKDIKYEK